VSRGTSGEAVGRLVEEKVGVTAGIVTVGVHSNERVMSPASRVASRDPATWLRTGVSSGNRPTSDAKITENTARYPEGPAGTEYLEDAALELRGKVR